jgi:DNA-binding response OmpR family regulator
MDEIRSALLIDYNDIENFINHRLLQSHGVTHIISFHDSVSALAYLKDTHVIYRMIIVNIDAPEINGIEFIHQFFEAGLENTQGDVYALSSSTKSIEKIKSENKSVKSISKPLTLDQLIDTGE